MSVPKKLEALLADARNKKTWGEITVTLKDGLPVLIRTTSQEKAEDYPASDTKNFR
jgi:hypothetical protein